MIYLPLSLVRPDMVLARPISIDPCALPLMRQGQPLSAFIIKKIEKLEIPGIYVESQLGSDVEIDEFMDADLRQQLAMEIRTIYQNYRNQVSVTHTSFNKISLLIDRLLDDLLSKRNHLLNTIETKGYDSYIYSHSVYVGALVALIGSKLKYTRDQLISLTLSGFLHDIGEIDTPTDLLEKRGKLSEEEIKIVQQHPQNAVRRLENGRTASQIFLRGIESHHEKFDGSGYPFGLAGEDIPEMGRILAIADVYDALTSHRPYRAAWFPGEAVDFMVSCSGTHFDPVILKAFMRTIAAYPTGTVVKLSNGEMGLAVSSSSDNILRPSLQLLLPEDKRGQEVNLLTDRNYLNVTITGIVKDPTEFPTDLF